MPNHIPSMMALRAFAAVAEHLSVNAAANELHLTHGAISHQIKNLEQELQQRLVAREGRGIVLTTAGQLLAQKLRPLLIQLAQVVNESRGQKNEKRLRISVLPSFAARWLLPRLPRFMAQFPEIELSLHASLDLVDFRRDDMDLAIRYGTGNWPDTHAIEFLKEEIFPVCSPNLNLGRLPRTIAAMLEHPLLRDVHCHWKPWLQAAGLSVREPRNVLVYNDSGLLVQSAVAGQGIALVRSALAMDDLTAGRLVRLNGPAIPARSSYYLVGPACGVEGNNQIMFLQWLQSEAMHMQAGPTT